MKNWTQNASDEYALTQGCYYDEAAADRVNEFFRKFLRHSKGQFAGKPFELLPWQREKVFGPLFGWKRKDGTRRFRRAFVEIPKKNGKSTTAAGVGLYMLIADGEAGAEVYSAACSREQASIVHGEAVNMVKASDGLAGLLRVNKATKEILFDRKNSKYRALASEAHSVEGLNSHCLIMDELHAWKGEPGRRFYDALKYAGRARRQPLTFIITTAGDDELSVCYELYQYAKQVQSGQVEDARFFTYIAEADVGDDWTKEEIWYKANPSMGETMSVDEFAADLREAQQTPTSLAQFLRYSFNLWAQTGGVAAITPEAWAACREEFTEDDVAGWECWAAIDLARTKDMTAIAFVFRDPNDWDKFRVLAYFWLPADTVRAEWAPEQFRLWAKQGLIRTTEGNVTDYKIVGDDIVELFKKFNPANFAFDPYFAEEITQRVSDEVGVDRIAFTQTAPNFASPCAEFERRILSKRLRHNGNRVLAWQIGNLRWKVDVNGNRRPIKPQDVKKIDGVVAAIMATAQEMANPPYQGGGLTWG